MTEPTTILRIKCGQIYILSNNKFSLICAFCELGFYELEDLRVHLTEHFPDSPTKEENVDTISCGSDCEFIPSDEVQDDMKELTDYFSETQPDIINEDIKRDRESIPPEIHDDLKEPIVDNLQDDLNLPSKSLTSVKLNEICRSEKSEDPLERIGNDNEITKAKKDEQINSTLDRQRNQREPNTKICSSELNFIESNPVTMLRTMDSRDPKYRDGFQCPVCKKTYSRKINLRFHIRANHLPDTDPRRYFPCKICDVKFKSYTQLLRHIVKRQHRINVPILVDKEGI